MKKKFIVFIIFVISITTLSFLKTFGEYSWVVEKSPIPVEDVFLDIDKNYKYYHELQSLYDRGIIEPEADHKFHPNKLLNRDDFIGIAMETACNRCIQPHTEQSFFKYKDKRPFFDVGIDNKNYYCIAYAADKKYTVGYRDNGKNTECNDGTYKKGEIPFCLYNPIKNEEAIAIMMRVGKILTDQQAERTVKQINQGKNFPNVANITPKNSDSSTYRFYPYYVKNENYTLIEYDKQGHKKEYKFTKKDKNGNYHPKNLVTKEEFLIMAYITLKANACPPMKKVNLALKMFIYDKECNANLAKQKKCPISTKQDPEDTFDFDRKVAGVCEKGIDPVKGYYWRIVDLETGKTVPRDGEFIDNYKFLKSGKYKIFVRATDRCGQTAEVWDTINIKKNGDFKVAMKANPIEGYRPLPVDYEGIPIGGCSPYRYYWNYGDGGVGRGKYPRHIFQKEGFYQTILTIFDCKNRKADASVIIHVLDTDCKNDKDGDGILDCKDKCPLVPGNKINAGCPVIKLATHNISLPSCLKNQKTKGYIFGNVTCTTCPCNNFIDFLANLRACDTVVSTITSVDERDIFARGKGYYLGNILK